MTGTDLCVNKPHKSRSYLNHLVFSIDKICASLMHSLKLTKINDIITTITFHNVITITTNKMSRIS
jgi:hypothetical protein